ncbi:ATP-binding protein [Azospirillum halopraeferens]|uniref:ATP-binding protein n=1 Tax=Azospirillum halopraeferens TaxID=34010 RepID=UPI00042695AE|nr:ATP-binding protein [Azospirillum halopraeferens]
MGERQASDDGVTAVPAGGDKAVPTGGPAGRLAARLDGALGSVRFLMVASGAAFIAVVNALIGYGIWQQHQRAVEGVRTGTENLVRMLDEQVSHTVSGVDRLFADVAHVLRIHPDAGVRGAPAIHAYLRDRADAFAQVTAIVVVGPDGHIRHHTGDTDPPAVDLSDRTYFRAHRDPPDGGLFLGAPVPSRVVPGKTVIPLSRRLTAPDGGFNGVLVMMVSPDHLDHGFEAVRAGQTASMTLALADGSVLVHRQAAGAAGAAAVGRDAAPMPAAALAVAMTGGPERTQRLPGPDGGEQLVSFRRVSPYPLLVVASTDLRAALADWRRDSAAWGFIGLSMTLAIALLTLFVVGQHRRREQDQAKLAQASRRIRGILDSMVDAVVTIDSRGRIETFNPAAERLFGYREDEVVGRSIGILVPEPFRADHDRWLRNYRPGAGSRIIGSDREVQALRRDGSAFPMTLAVSELVPDRGSGQRPDHRVFVGVVRDITLRKQKEAELLAAKSQAELANRAKSEFLANMSHELRTPLNAIIGFSEILDSEFFGKLNERQKSCAKDIHDSGKHLLDIVNAVLDMSKIEAGRYELSEEVIDPGEAVAQCLMMVRDRAADAGVDLHNAISGPLPYVWADRRAFKQVLLNLLSNAVKFTPAGGSVTLRAGIEEDGSLAVSVCDTGIGIPREFMEHLFEPFRQAETSANRRYEGTGLGLSISKNFMELHGGTLRCRSEVGVGTTMTASLPAGRIVPDGPGVGRQAA